MTRPIVGRATYEDLRRVPDHLVAEIIDGELMNPRTLTLEVFQLAGGGWSLVAAHSDTDVVRAQPFEAIELDLGSLWLPARPLA